jgi:hypothetical protein
MEMRGRLVVKSPGEPINEKPNEMPAAAEEFAKQNNSFE